MHRPLWFHKGQTLSRPGPSMGFEFKKSEYRAKRPSRTHTKQRCLNPKLETPAFVPQGGTSRRQAKLLPC